MAFVEFGAGAANRSLKLVLAWVDKTIERSAIPYFLIALSQRSSPFESHERRDGAADFRAARSRSVDEIDHVVEPPANPGRQ